MKISKEKKNNNIKGITLIVLILIIVALIAVVGVIVTLVVQLNKNNTEISNNEISSQNIINAENDNSESKKTEKKERKKATVPEGFYHIEGTTEEEGFVISDVEGDDLDNTAGGNQYVWIPVDGILGEDGTIDNVKDGEILLGRYEFEEDGTPKEVQDVYKEKVFSAKEEEISEESTAAKDIEGFIDSVRENGGYYFARFEASQGENNKVESKYNKPVWNNVTRGEASNLCQDLYTNITSDLINSYSWDTAILFIQKYGQNNYSQQKSLNEGLHPINTGMSGDVQLNICDMGSNCLEWTTETMSKWFPCVARGGCYSRVGTSSNTSLRFPGENSGKGEIESFRSILYL